MPEREDLERAVDEVLIAEMSLALRQSVDWLLSMGLPPEAIVRQARLAAEKAGSSTGALAAGQVEAYLERRLGEGRN